MGGIISIIVVYVFELHEYLISRHLIWPVLCSLLYDQEGSLKSISYQVFTSLLISGILSKDSNLSNVKDSSSLTMDAVHNIVYMAIWVKRSK